MEAQISEPIRFRPSKRRKTYRQRKDEEEQDEPQKTSDHEETKDLSTAPQPPSRATAADFFEGQQDPDSNDDDNTGGNAPQPSAVAVIKARNAHRGGRFRGGVAFRAGSRPGETDPAEQTTRTLVLRDQAEGDEAQKGTVAVSGITDRFTHQTGFVGDVNDRHMNEYIESRLSSRADPGLQSPNDLKPDDEDEHLAPGAPTLRQQQQPPLQARLMEVDLPALNTTSASGHRAGQQASSGRGSHQASSNPLSGAGAPQQKKQRLGPDGKPWRSRKRRGSDDIKRDQLVEQFLSENRLDVYDVPDPKTSATNEDEADGDADERVAEQFKAQFEADVARRRLRKKKPTQNPPASKAKTENVLKGPKLGGSRNSRAAVRNALLKEKNEASKK